MQHMNYIGLGT